MPKLKGVGVDLVSLGRVKKFLDCHPLSRIERIMGAEERKSLKTKGITPLQFAKRFAAKESFFKATNQSWMGLDGFSKMNVTFLKRDRFRVEQEKSSRSGALSAEGCFFKSQDWIGAHVILWEMEH